MLLSLALPTTRRSTAPQPSSTTIRGLSIANPAAQSQLHFHHFILVHSIVQRTTNNTIVALTIALEM